MNLSVITVAKDEEKNIKDCLKSVKWADELIVIIDDRTADKTAEIAKKYGAKVFFKKFDSFGKQLKYALDKAKGDWVLWLDADERITPALKKEIIAKMNSGKFNGYHAFFHIVFLGKDMGSFAKEVQGGIRLFRRKKTRLIASPIHPRFVVEGKVEKLENRIVHHTYRTISQTLTKFNQFSSIEAEQLYRTGGRTNIFFIIFAPAYAFFREFFLWKNYRNGFYGLVYSLLFAQYYLLKHLKIWELQKSAKINQKI